MRRFDLPGQGLSITQITTFCPDDFGPGHTNLHLIEADKLILLDTGVPTRLIATLFYSRFGRQIPPEVEALPPDLNERTLAKGFELAGRTFNDLDLLVLSHGHWDHFLLGDHIVRQSGAKVAAHVLDTPTICNPWSTLLLWTTGWQQARSLGMPLFNAMNESQAFRLQLQTTNLALEVDFPIIEQGSLEADIPVSGVQVKHLPGHSPGSIGLIVGEDDEDKVLLPGDVLLDAITPIPTDLLAYLRTLEDLENMGNFVLALPAHGDEIRDVKARLAFLWEHHRRRLGLTHHVCRKPASIWDVATTDGYFDVPVDPGEFNFLAGLEAMIHVELLSMAGGVRRCDIRDGVHYFLASNETFEAVFGRVMELVRDRAIIPLARF
ncbi:MAG: MBL fold metallo-hydrolase [Proteobacteria bacterium]|nr:MBL fold metallo-hydrolase [Pseudomonadota bacterium]MBU1740684.1 MBL fold metallo-hydrolase [Pseudomonadota bacterium]